jgi:MATE family, multidrug efflux pump
MDSILDSKVTRLTQGAIGKALFALSIPIVLSNTLLTTHQMVNAFWLGRLGAAAMAAVSVSFPVIFVLVSLGGGLAVAASILVAQYAGARNPEAVNHVSAQSLLMVVTISALLSVIGYLSANLILRLMGVGPDIFEDSARYMRVSFMGIVFMFSIVTIQSILRGTGEVKIPLYLITFSVLLNLVLDPIFIFGWGPVPQTGVVGAAYATLITQGLPTLLALRVLAGGQYGVRLRRQDFVPDVALARRALLLGLPASVEQSIHAFSITVYAVLASHFGTTAIAAFGIGLRVLVLAMIPAFGISMATTTLVGQSIGAGNFARAKEIAVVSARYAFWLLTGATILIFGTAQHVMSVFAPGDPALVREGAEVVRCLALCFGMMGVEMTLIGAVRGVGDTTMPMALAFVSVWLIEIPVAYSLSHHTSLGEHGLWYTFPIYSASAMLLAIALFKKQRWKPLAQTKENELKKKVTEEILMEEGRL